MSRSPGWGRGGKGRGLEFKDVGANLEVGKTDAEAASGTRKARKAREKSNLWLWKSRCRHEHYNTQPSMNRFERTCSNLSSVLPEDYNRRTLCPQSHQPGKSINHPRNPRFQYNHVSSAYTYLPIFTSRIYHSPIPRAEFENNPSPSPSSYPPHHLQLTLNPPRLTSPSSSR
jgi:hypothetical protein